MAFSCEICGKRRQKGNRISHSHIKTRKFQEPNLQVVKALIDGRVQRVRVCTRCIRSGRVIKSD